MRDGLTPLGPIPDGWSAARLRELSSLIERGITPRYVDNSPHIVVNQRSIRWVGIDYSAVKHLDLAMAAEVPTRKRLAQGDVVLNSTGDITIGRACLIREPVENHVPDSHVTIIRLRKELLEPYLLVQLLQMPHFQREIYTVTSGSTGQLELSRQAVANLVLPVPPPPEQRKIAEILSSVDDAIEKTEAVIEQVQRVKQGLAQQLLTRGLPDRHTRFKQTEVGEIPLEWEVVRLGEVAEVVSGFALGPARRPRSSPRPYLTVANVQTGKILVTDVRYMEVAPSEYEARKLTKGDVVMVEGHAQLSELGRAAIVPTAFEGFTYQNHLFRVRVDLERCDPLFLCTYVNDSHGRTYFRSFGGTTSGLNTVSTSNVKGMPMPLPPTQEQRLVAGALAAIESRIESESTALQRLRNAKAALMHVLLTGQVRVKVPATSTASGEKPA
jgi:type I restriction enzyme S subunit